MKGLCDRCNRTASLSRVEPERPAVQPMMSWDRPRALTPRNDRARSAGFVRILSFQSFRFSPETRADQGRFCGRPRGKASFGVESELLRRRKLGSSGPPTDANRAKRTNYKGHFPFKGELKKVVITLTD